MDVNTVLLSYLQRNPAIAKMSFYFSRYFNRYGNFVADLYQRKGEYPILIATGAGDTPEEALSNLNLALIRLR